MSERRIIVWVQNRGDRQHLSLEWIDPITGKRKSKSAHTCNPVDAEQARADLEYELNHNLHLQPSAMTWEKFRQLFEEEFVVFRRENTRENYKVAFDWFEKLDGPRLLKSVNERAVSAYAAGLGKQGFAPSTIKQRLALLHTALRWAVRQRLLPVLPDFPQVKVPRKKPQPVPLESFERLIDKAPDLNMRVYLLTGWLAGLRLVEAAELEWEPTEKAPYLDPLRSRIVLPAEIVKGVEDQWVPLDPQLWEVLQMLPRHGPKVFRFVDARDGHRISPSGIGERIIRLAKVAGVKITMRTLRRGFGCRYAGKVPAQVLQKLMRHANISTTMSYYANVDEAVMQAVLGNSDPLRVSSRVTSTGPTETAVKVDDATPGTATGSGQD